MQAITQKANAAFITNLSNILNKPARSLGTLILDTQARKDLDVICDGASLGISSQFTHEASFAPSNPLDLLIDGDEGCEADRSEWALLNGAVTLSIAANANVKTFDEDMFYLAQARLKPLEDMFVEGLCDITELRNFYTQRKGHTIFVKGVKMIRRVGRFFC